MSVDQGDSTRKKSGGRKSPHRKTKKHQLGNQFTEPELGNEDRLDSRKVKGKGTKHQIVRASTVNLSRDGETVKAEIERVVSNDANQNYVRRSLLTKGTVIETSEGRAKITSRPGQEGALNAVEIEEK